MNYIIQEFESKLKLVWWEKVYCAREIMKIFGYDKWERFLWAINRAKNEINDDKIINDNFYFITNKDTWWRPREDVLLTLWACYFVLKKCDNRKENILIMKEYLENLLKEKKSEQKINKIKIPYEKIVFWVIVIFLILSFIYYITTYLSFFINSKNIYDFSNFSKELKIQESIQNSIIKNYEENIFSSWTSMVNQKTGALDWINSWSILQKLDYLSDYINSGNKNLIFFDKQFNYRSDFLKGVYGENLIKYFFDLGNKSFYRDSCSLLSKKLCISNSKWNLKVFSNFWEKTISWNELLEVKKINQEKNKNIYCIKYRYKLKFDTSNNFITETFNYTTEFKNWKEQITQRYCENIEKWWKNIKCPYKLKRYYCN